MRSTTIVYACTVGWLPAFRILVRSVRPTLPVPCLVRPSFPTATLPAAAGGEVLEGGPHCREHHQHQGSSMTKKKTVKHKSTSDVDTRFSNQRARSIDPQGTLWRIFMLDQLGVSVIFSLSLSLCVFERSLLFSRKKIGNSSGLVIPLWRLGLPRPLLRLMSPVTLLTTL